MTDVRRSNASDVAPADDVLGMLSGLQDVMFEAYRDGLVHLQSRLPGAGKKRGSRGSHRGEELIPGAGSAHVPGVINGRQVSLSPPVYADLSRVLAARVERLRELAPEASAIERRLLLAEEGPELDAVSKRYDDGLADLAREMRAVSHLLAYRHVVDVAIPLEAQRQAHSAAEDLLAQRAELLASFTAKGDRTSADATMRRAAHLLDEARDARRDTWKSWPGRVVHVVSRPPRIRTAHLSGGTNTRRDGPRVEIEEVRGEAD